MASLTGNTIQSTYDSLLKVTDNDSITGSLKRITDGLGNNTPLYLSTSAVEIVSTLNVTSTITASNLSGTNTGDETKASIETKLGAATSSNSGYLTSTDWSTFNNKIAGTGTLNKLAKFSSSSSIADSTITDTGSAVTIGVATSVTGSLTASSLIRTGGTSSQFLKADGSVDSTSYQPILTNPVTGTGTTNTLPKFTGTSTIGNSNISDSGTLISLGSNTNIGTGALGIAQSTLTGFVLRASKSITGATSSLGISVDGAIQSDVTSRGSYYHTSASTQNTAFTLGILDHYFASGGSSFGSATVTNQYGFRVDSTLTGATNNYGFFGNIGAGTGRWNLYMAGTANNYLAGNLSIGTTATGRPLTLFAASGQNNYIEISGNGNTVGTASFAVGQGADNNAYVFNRANSALIIATNSAERARFLAGGNLLINATVDNGTGARLQVNGAISANNGMIVQGYSAAASGLNVEMGVTGGYAQFNAYNRSTSAYGSFRLDGSNIILNAGSGGNVGIGTSSPVAISNYTTLDVRGTNGSLLYMGQAGATAGLRLIGEGTDGYIDNLTTGGSLLFRTNNATERMRITSGGNVGIGTSSPSTSLNIIGAVNTSVGNLSLTSSNNDASGISFKVRSSPGDPTNSRSWMIHSNYSAAGTLEFLSSTTATGDPTTTRVTIDRTGKIGVGTISPSELLTLNSTDIYKLSLKHSDGSAAALGASSNNFLFYNNGAERMRISSAGNVGIGINSPSYRLDVAHASAGELIRGSYTGGTKSPFLAFQANDDALMYLASSNSDNTSVMGFKVNGTERMRINAAGNVGIGTSSPSLPLHIYNSGAALAYFESTNANGAYAIWRNSGTSIGDVGAALGISGSGSASDFMIASRSGNMILGTGSAERMRITSGGLVGIGTSSPASKLNISGDNITVSAGYGIAWAGDQTRIMTPEDNVSGALIRYGSGGIMRFVNGSTEHMRINGSGNVGINTSSPSYKLDVNGDIRSTGAIRVNTGTIDTALTFDTSAGAVGTVTNHNLNFWINGTTQAKLTTDAQLYVGTGIVSSSAKVQIDSTTKGFLPPRMTSLQRIAIASPAVGLMVYQTDNAGGLGGNEGLYIYKSGGWTFII